MAASTMKASSFLLCSCIKHIMLRNLIFQKQSPRGPQPMNSCFALVVKNLKKYFDQVVQF